MFEAFSDVSPPSKRLKVTPIQAMGIPESLAASYSFLSVSRGHGSSL